LCSKAGIISIENTNPVPGCYVIDIHGIRKQGICRPVCFCNSNCALLIQGDKEDNCCVMIFAPDILFAGLEGFDPYNVFKRNSSASAVAKGYTVI